MNRWQWFIFGIVFILLGVFLTLTSPEYESSAFLVGIFLGIAFFIAGLFEKEERVET